MIIKSKNIKVSPKIKYGQGIEIVASDSVYIGPNTMIGDEFKVRCRKLHIGEHCYIESNCQIGGGGSYGPNANVFIDDHVGLMENVYINCAESVTIGKYCGIGQDVKIWTHGGWLPVAEGFPPQKQKSVHIGHKVWIPARTQILAGVEIGNNVVIGINSLVTKNIPAGSFAAGQPAKIIKEKMYPRELCDDELMSILKNLVEQYYVIADDKGFKPEITINANLRISFKYKDEEVIFDPRTSKFNPCPDINKYAEDFRDYLRRNGFRFNSNKFFSSLTPIRFLNLNVEQY